MNLMKNMLKANLMKKLKIKKPKLTSGKMNMKARMTDMLKGEK